MKSTHQFVLAAFIVAGAAAATDTNSTTCEPWQKTASDDVLMAVGDSEANGRCSKETDTTFFGWGGSDILYSLQDPETLLKWCASKNCQVVLKTLQNENLYTCDHTVKESQWTFTNVYSKVQIIAAECEEVGKDGDDDRSVSN